MTDFSDDDHALMQRTARAVVERRLAVPAMMFLETVAPMNMVSASMLHLMSPAWRSALPGSRIDGLAALLERRDTIPELIRLIDEAEQARLNEQVEQARSTDRAEQTQPLAEADAARRGGDRQQASTDDTPGSST